MTAAPWDDPSTTRAACRLKDLLARITYRPGTRFYVTADQFAPVVLLRVERMVENSYRPGQMIPQTFTSCLATYFILDVTEKVLTDAVFRALMDMERHEAQEFFRLDGQVIYDPHASDPLKVGVPTAGHRP